MKDLSLYLADKNSILDGDWLTDGVIYAAQSLLKKQFPDVGGLQKAALGQTLSFDVVRGDFVQIILVRSNHWITISNISCDKNEVAVYDSKPTAYLSPDTKEKIASIICSDQTQFSITIKQVQRQNGSQDCGLFAIAFAHAICCGIDPTSLSFSQVSWHNDSNAL